MSEKDENDGIHLSLETTVLILMLIIYITSGPLLKRFKISLLRSSGFTMICGIIITILTYFLSPSSTFFKGFQFNSLFFFTFVLPWIIFNAGYSIKFHSFLKHFPIIIFLSIIGTLLTFIIIALINYSFNNTLYYTSNGHNDEKIVSLSLVEILQIAASLSAIDSISSVSILIDNERDKVTSISFGESIINNAICIALFRISSLSKKKHYILFTTWEVIYKCIIFFILSFIIGGLVGMLSSYFLEKLKIFKLNRVQEISIMLLFGCFSYFICDIFGLSSIVGLLSCGICMTHYTYYNLSFQAREESALISNVLCVLAEALVFSSLGMNILYYTTHSLSLSFILLQLIGVIISRIILIYIFGYLLNLGKSKIFLLKEKHKKVLTVIGGIRGAVSFAIAISINTEKQLHKEVILTSVIYVVFITNIGFNLIYNFIKVDDKYKPETSNEIYSVLHRDSRNKLKKDNDNKIMKKVEEFDEKNILPFLVSSWPEAQEDNIAINEMIMTKLNNWKQNEGNLEKEENKIEMNIFNSEEQQ